MTTKNHKSDAVHKRYKRNHEPSNDLELKVEFWYDVQPDMESIFGLFMVLG